MLKKSHHHHNAPSQISPNGMTPKNSMKVDIKDKKKIQYTKRHANFFVVNEIKKYYALVFIDR